MVLRQCLRLLGALGVSMVCAALLVGGAGQASGAPRVASAAVAGDACISKEDTAWLATQRRQVRADRANRLREREAERNDQQVLQEHRSDVHREQARRQVAIRQFEDLVPEEYHDLVLDTAEQFGLDPRLLASVGWVESQWYAYARGTQGDSGLMQILPSTGEWIASRLGMAQYDLYDPVTNLTMGAWYLRTLYREYGSWNMALAAYNGGPRAAPLGAEFPYTRLVMRVYHHQEG